MQKLPYDPLTDLTPVSMVTRQRHGVRGQQRPAGSFDARVHRLCPGQPGQDQLWRDRARRLAAISLRRPSRRARNSTWWSCPITATPPSIIALINGTIQVFFGNVSDIVESAQGGRCALLAFSTGKRAAAIPGYSDRCGDGAGLRHDRLEWLFRASRHAAPDRRSAGAKRLRTVCHDPEVDQAHGRPQRRCGRQHAGRTRLPRFKRICRSIARGGGRGPVQAIARACN